MQQNEMFPAQQGYDRAITVFSPDGRLYQVEYAIETVRRGTIAVGIKTEEGAVITVEEKARKLQIADNAQKIFQIDDHIGVAAAGYIPDARSQVDNARFFSQSSKFSYDEPAGVEAIAKHLADHNQQFTQYAGVRPYGVSLIIAGVDRGKSRLFLTDPSGTFISYDALAIGANSEKATEVLEKSYVTDMSLDDASALATAAVSLASKNDDWSEGIRMAHIRSDTAMFETVPDSRVEEYTKAARDRFPSQ